MTNIESSWEVNINHYSSLSETFDLVLPNSSPTSFNLEIIKWLKTTFPHSLTDRAKIKYGILIVRTPIRLGKQT